MWCEVIFLRRRGLRLRRAEWPEAVKGNLQIQQLHGPNNPFRQHIRMANIWEEFGTTSQRGLGVIYDPQPLWTPDADSILFRGIEVEVVDGRLIEHQQVWLARVTTQYGAPLPPFTLDVGRVDTV